MYNVKDTLCKERGSQESFVIPFVNRNNTDILAKSAQWEKASSLEQTGGQNARVDEGQGSQLTQVISMNNESVFRCILGPNSGD